MRGTRAKKERKLGLRSGPAERKEQAPRVALPNQGWERKTPLEPDAYAEKRSKAKRKRRNAKRKAQRRCTS